MSPQSPDRYVVRQSCAASIAPPNSTASSHPVHSGFRYEVRAGVER